MRYPDWPIRLNGYITSVRDETFQLGIFDCCTFAAGCVEAITGVDYMPEFRGHYDDWDSADEVLQSIGNRGLYRTLWKKFGPAISGGHGQVGDLAFYDGCCGVVLGRYGLFLGSGGFAHVRISYIQRAFKVI